MTVTPTKTKSSPFAILGIGFFVLLIIALVATFISNTKNPPLPPPPATTDSNPSTTPSDPPREATPTPPPTTYLQSDAIAFKPAPLPSDKIPKARETINTLHNTSKVPKDALKDAIQSFRDLNRVELGKKDDIRKAEQALSAQIIDLYGRHGAGGVLAATDTTYPSFRNALKTLAAFSKSSSTPLIDILQNPPKDNPKITDALEWVGNFALVGVKIGLISPDGTLPPRLEPVLEILYRYRWFTSMRSTINPKELMTLPEVQTLLLWRLHEAKNIATPRKVSYAIDAAKHIPGYPSTLAIGILYAQDKQLQKALLQFENARQLQPNERELAETYVRLLKTK